MHADEIPTSAELVRRLIAAQFPQWAGLPVAPVDSAGTDNAIYRLGTAFSVRLPRIRWATGQIELERQWLPRLAPALPVAIPRPVAVGVPALGFPYPWSVYAWLDGTNPVAADAPGLALELAAFITALRRIDTAGGPCAEPGRRGAPLSDQDPAEPIATLADRYDPAELTAAWESDAAAPPWDRDPVWLHGDLHAGNLLVRGGALAAVLDWSCLAVGDPAVDLIPAWSMLPPDARDAFRAALDPDDATWRRGRAWALLMAVNALPYYADTNPFLADLSRHIIAAVLTAHRTG